MNFKLRSVAVLVAIFVAGAATGVFLAFGPLRFLAPRRPPIAAFANRHLDQLTRALDLSEKQRTQVESLIKQTEARLEKARREARDSTMIVFRELNTQIKAVLTAEQLPKFDAFQQEQTERWREMERMHRSRMERGGGRNPLPQPDPEGSAGPGMPPPGGPPGGEPLPPPLPGG
jgi:Spy/CpxP family protein refolding chaperone